MAHLTCCFGEIQDVGGQGWKKSNASLNLWPFAPRPWKKAGYHCWSGCTSGVLIAFWEVPASGILIHFYRVLIPAATMMIWWQLSSDFMLMFGEWHARCPCLFLPAELECRARISVQRVVSNHSSLGQEVPNSRFTMGSLNDTFWNFQIGETCVVFVQFQHPFSCFCYPCYPATLATCRDLPPFLHEDGGEKRPKNANTLCAWDSQYGDCPDSTGACGWRHLCRDAMSILFEKNSIKIIYCHFCWDTFM